jgi:uncharacterized membrane protein (UPF0127 family)
VDCGWGRVLCLIAGAALSLSVAGCREETELSGPEWRRLPAKLTVEIARTEEERARGLKFRKMLPRDEGMYFLFDEERQLSFYMRDTRIPLSIAFIRSNGVIESVADMIPLDERSVYSKGSAQFALEANRGWFEKHGIGVGDRVVLEGNVVLF